MRQRIVLHQKLKDVKTGRVKDYDSWKAQGNKANPLAEPDTTTSLPTVYESEELKAALEVLDEGGESVLTPIQRQAFQMVVREGLPFDYVASELGVSIRTVRTHVSRAGKKLYKLCRTKLE